MTLLDRFRTQPQNHPDPAVRLAYLAELPITEREQIVAAARDDADPRVRKAAVAKILDPQVLAGIVRDEPDASVREAALTMLRDIALDAFEGVDEAGSLAAVETLDDVRTLAQIVKTSLRESVARRALALLAQAPGGNAGPIMSAVARQAELEPIRLAAFEYVSSREEFLALALHCDFKETALAAVDRLSDRHDLEEVAERAKNKPAAKRARQVLRERDDAAARAAAEDARAAQDAADQAHAGQAAAERAAREAAEQTEAELRVAAEAEAAQQSKERDEQRAREDAEGQARDAAALAAQDSAGQEAAAREAERRRINEEAEARTRRDALNRMNQLVGRVDAMMQKEDLSLKAADRALRDVRAALADIPPLPSRQDFEHVSTKLKLAQEAIAPRVRDLREVADWQRWANVGIQEQLCEKMEALRSETDPTPSRAASTNFSSNGGWRPTCRVRRAKGSGGASRPPTTSCGRDAKRTSRPGRGAHRELHEEDALCERAEALPNSTAGCRPPTKSKPFRREWKAIGPVTRGQEKAIWERFRAACDTFFTRRQDDLSSARCSGRTTSPKKKRCA